MKKSVLREILRKVIVNVIKEESQKLPKGKWVVASDESLKSFREELFNMIKKTYAGIGGHHDYKSPADINKNDANYWELIDTDADNTPDAVNASKTTKFGKKSVMGATDGSSEAKKALVMHKIVTLKKPGYYVEVSERIADILLTAKVPVVNDEQEVRKVLGKEIKWIGTIPGKLGDGWYSRSLGGSDHAKIMLGNPKI